MTTIDQLLKLKGHDFHAVSPTETVYAAIKLMADRNVGSVLVIEGGALIGIVTERHYAREVALKGRTSPKTLVRDIMDKHVPCVSPGQSVEACLALMTDKRVRHLPVLERRRVVGLVSIGDLVKSIIDDQRYAIDQLETYIHGERCQIEGEGRGQLTASRA
jgi:CBS domain-containing protein